MKLKGTRTNLTVLFFIYKVALYLSEIYVLKRFIAKVNDSGSQEKISFI